LRGRGARASRCIISTRRIQRHSADALHYLRKAHILRQTTRAGDEDGGEKTRLFKAAGGSAIAKLVSAFAEEDRLGSRVIDAALGFIITSWRVHFLHHVSPAALRTAG